MSVNIRKNDMKFYGIVLMIALFIAVNTLQRLQLHMVVNQVQKDGIEYEAFREMKLNKLNIPINTLTLSMMVKDYDLLETRTLTKLGTNYLLNYLSSNPSYQELKKYYSSILNDIRCFPVPCDKDNKPCVSYVNSWNAARSYGGKRKHEGCDLMAKVNKRGYYQVISMTDGIVEKMGWLNQGGYRIGIRGLNGAYFYYAHLDSYAPNMKIGDVVQAGEFLGYMGDSGYGIEGTKGMFDVHLHVGIYVQAPSGELSVNPYYILRNLENE